MNQKKHDYKKMYGFLGIGQCGGNIVSLFSKAGYPSIIANSSKEDLNTIENVDNKFHFRYGEGCHKDRQKSKKLLADNLDSLISEVKSVMTELKTLFVVASSAGGTGSGMLGALAEILQGVLNVNVSIVTVLPSKSEHFQACRNSVELFTEISENSTVGATFILDNEAKQNKLKINEIFFTHLDALLSNENGSVNGCLDRSEIDKLLSTPGMAVMAKLGPDKKGELLHYLIEDNIYAPIEKNKVVQLIGITVCEDEYDVNGLTEEIGVPYDTYIGTNAPAYVCMLAGLSLPKTRLNEIRVMAKSDYEMIRKNQEGAKENLFDDDLDFLKAGMEDRSPGRKEKPSKVPNSRDVLMKYL